jgi:hypothetical protein
MNRYLKHYLVAVEHPEVSGFEHLEMLLVRDKLAEQESLLTAEEKAQLTVADQQLIKRANEFYTELSRVTDLKSERQQRHPDAKQWWWYLDVLTNLPSPPLQSQASELAV